MQLTIIVFVLITKSSIPLILFNQIFIEVNKFFFYKQKIIIHAQKLPF